MIRARAGGLRVSERHTAGDTGHGAGNPLSKAVPGKVFLTPHRQEFRYDRKFRLAAACAAPPNRYAVMSW